MKKMLKISSIFLIFGIACFSCKQDQNQAGQVKALMLSSFKVGDSLYNKAENKISITKSTLSESDLKEVVFTDESGNVVQGVNWKMEPDRVRPTPEAKFKIVVSSPPSGYKAYESDEITVVKELVSPKILSIVCHGVHADVSKDPITVRVPKPTVQAPIAVPGGGKWGDISVQFDKDVPDNMIVWEGLPGDAGNPQLKAEEVAHVTIKVAQKDGAWKAGEYKLDITFDTPTISIKSFEITDQDGDVDVKNLKVNLKNKKESIADSDVKIIFEGEYVDPSELAGISPAYEGLPLNGLKVSEPKTFKVKVPAKPSKYKAFEADITVVRANEPLKLKKISIFGQDMSDLNTTPFTYTVNDTTKTFVRKGDIKATFEKPKGGEFEFECLLKDGNEAYLKAGVDTLITFYVPATDDYAEYRNQVKITHTADWKKMIAMPIPDEGVTFKSGNRDDIDKKIDRKFEVAQFPVTWKIFKEVCEWANDPAKGKAKGYANFDLVLKFAQNGAIAKDGGGYAGFPEDASVMPVCLVSYHAALAWCNAYSEMNGYIPAYYKPEKGKIDMDWGTPETPDYKMYTSFTPIVKISETLSKEEIDKLALRDALTVHHPSQYDEQKWSNIRDNYYKTAILTSKQAKVDDGEKSGYRFIDTLEWEFAGRLRLTKGKYCTTSSLSYNGKTYYFADKDSAPGSEGYGDNGSEIEKVAWVSANSSVDGKLQTHPIGHRRPTDLGIYDLAGNVGSWTNSWSKSNGSAGEGVNDYNVYSVGGGFCDPAHRCVVIHSVPSSDGRYYQCGIRLARTLK